MIRTSSPLKSIPRGRKRFLPTPIQATHSSGNEWRLPPAELSRPSGSPRVRTGDEDLFCSTDRVWAIGARFGSRAKARFKSIGLSTGMRKLLGGRERTMANRVEIGFLKIKERPDRLGR